MESGVKGARPLLPMFYRGFAMPSSETFALPPVTRLLERWLPDIKRGAVVVDPFSGNSRWANYTNDLNPETPAMCHLHAEEFIRDCTVTADVVLFDPPYSPRQIAEVYAQVGKTCKKEDTQNARLYKRVKDGLDRILKDDGIAICCGWNSMGFGLGRGYELLEVLLVAHGGAHNDTIVTVERKHADRSRHESVTPLDPAQTAEEKSGEIER